MSVQGYDEVRVVTVFRAEKHAGDDVEGGGVVAMWGPPPDGLWTFQEPWSTTLEYFPAWLTPQSRDRLPSIR